MKNWRSMLFASLLALWPCRLWQHPQALQRLIIGITGTITTVTTTDSR